MHIFDLKGMIIEARTGVHCKSLQEFYDKIPVIKPTSVEFFRPCTEISWKTGRPMNGHYEIINMGQPEALPKFDWATFYHMPEVAEVGAEEAVRRSRASGGPLERVESVYVPHVPETFTVADVNLWR